MAVDLPAEGEEPWDTKLNTAITGIDSRLTTVESGGGGGGTGGTVDEGLSGSWFQGRRWYACGTSLTSQNFYTSALATISGMTLTNCGASGGTLSTQSNGNVWSYMTSQVLNDAEVVTLETTNDFRLNVPLGVQTDAEDPSISYWGAIKAACNWLLTNRPAARIFFLTSYSDALQQSGFPNFRIANTLGFFQWQYNAAMTQAGEIYGIPVIDVAGESGINYYTAPHYTADGLHVNTLGGQRYAEYVWSRIRLMGWLDSAPTATGPPVNVAVTGVSIDQTGPLALAAGGTSPLSATIAPSNASNKGISWSSSNTSVATVSGIGMVTAVANGSATITVTTSDGGHTATIGVNVSAAAVTGVALAPTSVRMLPSTTQQLTATVSPTNASNKTVTWQSSATAVATVSSSGLVTSVANGTATITVTTQDGGFVATSAITVSSTIPVTNVTLSPPTASVTTGLTVQLTPTITPTNATNKSVSYNSSSTGIATVSSSGLVTGVAIGSCTITVTTQDGSFTASTTVTVTAVEWVMNPQTVFRNIAVGNLTSTGQNPTYTSVTSGGLFGAILWNNPGDNAIEFAVGNASLSCFVVIGSNGTNSFIAIGSSATAFDTFKTLGDFPVGSYTNVGSSNPAPNPSPGWANGAVFRVGRSGNKVKIVRVDGGTALTTIWQGDLPTNFPTQSADYGTVDLGFLAYTPATYPPPINCGSGVWTPP